MSSLGVALHCSALLPTYKAHHARTTYRMVLSASVAVPHVEHAMRSMPHATYIHACNMQHATVRQALFRTSLDSLNIIGYSIAILGVMGYKSGRQYSGISKYKFALQVGSCCACAWYYHSRAALMHYRVRGTRRVPMGSRSRTAALCGWIKVQQDMAKTRDEPECRPLLSPHPEQDDRVAREVPEQ